MDKVVSKFEYRGYTIEISGASDERHKCIIKKDGLNITQSSYKIVTLRHIKDMARRCVDIRYGYVIVDQSGFYFVRTISDIENSNKFVTKEITYETAKKIAAKGAGIALGRHSKNDRKAISELVGISDNRLIVMPEKYEITRDDTVVFVVTDDEVNRVLWSCDNNTKTRVKKEEEYIRFMEGDHTRAQSIGRLIGETVMSGCNGSVCITIADGHKVECNVIAEIRIGNKAGVVRTSGNIADATEKAVEKIREEIEAWKKSGDTGDIQ